MFGWSAIAARCLAVGTLSLLAACGEVLVEPRADASAIDASGDATTDAGIDDGSVDAGARVRVSVTRSGDGEGAIQSDPAGIDCGASCTATFVASGRIVLTAAPAVDARFGGWTGACSGLVPTCELTPSVDVEVGAAFDRARDSLTVSLAGTGGGRVQSDVGGIDCPGVCARAYDTGSQVVLTATAQSGSRFDGWAGTAGCSGTDPCALSMTEARAVVAIFTDVTVPLTVTRAGTGAGLVSSSPLGISCGATCEARFLPGTSIDLVATPDASSRFQGWSGACTGRNPTCTLTSDAPRAVTATFHANVIHDVTVGLQHTCALLDPDRVRCFGSSEYGQLGYGDHQSRGDGLGPPANAGDVEIDQVLGIGSGHWHNCAILQSGQLSCWGRNEDGQLGYGDLINRSEPGPPISLGSAVAVTQVVGGAFHTCALVSGEVRCWGQGAQGALGYGDGSPRSAASLVPVPLAGGPTVLQIAAGGVHTCALIAPGNVRCWGGNSFGQLGYGDTMPRGATPTSVPVGDVDLGPGLVTQISAGGLHTCARLANGQVRCWGRNFEAQLGYGDLEHRGDDAQDNLLQSVPLPGPAIAVAAGNEHTCALMSDRSVRCWGRSVDGQLGYGDTMARGDGVGPPAGSAALVFPGNAMPTRLWAGRSYHTCALLGPNALSCWGRGSSGQLGHGGQSNRGDGLGPSVAAGNVPIF